jgi:hypothetical protein
MGLLAGRPRGEGGGGGGSPRGAPPPCSDAAGGAHAQFGATWIPAPAHPPAALLLELAAPDDVPHLSGTGGVALSALHDGFSGVVLCARGSGGGVEVVRRRYYGVVGDAPLGAASHAALGYPAHGGWPLPTLLPRPLLGQYVGASDAGVRHGRGAMQWARAEDSGRGLTAYAGEWRADVPHGFGELRWEGGALYVGQVAEGEAHGKGVGRWPPPAPGEAPRLLRAREELLDPASRVCTRGWGHLASYNGHWHRGEPAGTGVGVWFNGAKYEGEWARGAPAGRGTLTLAQQAPTAGEAGAPPPFLAAFGVGAAVLAAAGGGAVLLLHAAGEWEQGALHGEGALWTLWGGVPPSSYAAAAAAPSWMQPLPAFAAAEAPEALHARLLAGTLADRAVHAPFSPPPRAAAAHGLLPLVSPPASPAGGSLEGGASVAGSVAASVGRDASPAPPLPARASLHAAGPAEEAGEGLFPPMPPGATLLEAFSGGFVDGLRHCAMGSQMGADGAVYHGAFRGGRRNGHGTLRGADRAVFQGKFVAGVAEGRGVVVAPGPGAVSEGMWAGGAQTARTGGTASRLLPEAERGWAPHATTRTAAQREAAAALYF